MDWPARIALALTTTAALTFGANSLIGPVKVVSDGPIYHLYFAAQWWKAGRLSLVPVPFGESAAPYFPAVGDLWFTWLMCGDGGLFLSKIGQAPFWVLGSLAAYALARRIGAGQSSAVVATCWFATSMPLLLFSFEANVDSLFVAGLLCAVFFLVRFWLDDGGWRSLFLCGLAVGLAWCTKPTGLVFVPPFLGLAVILVIVGRKSVASRLLALVIGTAIPTAYWFGRNLLLTGNPVYPVHLEIFGRTIFQGWYRTDAMRESGFYLPVGALGALWDILLAVLDPRLAPIWLAAVIVAPFLVRSDPRVRMMLGLLSAWAVVNVLLYWLAVPYRTQQRFMLQALGLAVPALAVLFDRSGIIRVAASALLALHCLTPQAWPVAGAGRDAVIPWDGAPGIPNGIPALIAPPVPVDSLAALGRLSRGPIDYGLWPWAALASALALGLISAWGWDRPRWRTKLTVGLTGFLAQAGVIAAAIYPWGDDPRLRFYPLFPDYARGWLALDRRTSSGPARIAYAGTNIPFYLMGPDLRNDVRYININAHPGWRMHDYHRAATARGKATWPNPRPGWDREDQDYAAWLDNLRTAHVDYLVVTRANPAEGPHNPYDDRGFPIERTWARTHPDVFAPVYGPLEDDPEFWIYRIRED